jgi:hypothetical protein
LVHISNLLNKATLRYGLGVLGLFIALGILVAFSWSFPTGPDWPLNFRLAALELLHLKSPYTIGGFYNPPWALLPLIPFAVLPERTGGFLISFMTLLSYGYVAHRMGAKPLTLGLMLVSPPALMAANNANIEWLVVLGFILPPQIGLFFILMKPQIGIGLALFWLVQAYRRGRIKEVIKVFAPVTVAFLISFLLFGLYPVKGLSLTPANETIGWNMSAWPLSLMFGLPLLIYSIRKQKQNLSISAGPMLSPYVGGYSWIMLLFGLLPHQWEACAAALIMWAVWFL